MDHHEEEYQNEDLSAGGVYPEPDFHPHYPWLGEAIHKAVPLVHEGFLPQDPESLNDDGQDAASPSSARTFSSPGIGESKHCYDTRSREKRHAIESSVDPDFVTQDNSVVYALLGNATKRTLADVKTGAMNSFQEPIQIPNLTFYQ